MTMAGVTVVPMVTVTDVPANVVGRGNELACEYDLGPRPVPKMVKTDP